MAVKSYDELIDVLSLWKMNLGTYETEVGATEADITWSNNTLGNLVYLRDYCATYDANKKACFDIKQSLFNAPEGSPVSDPPPMPEPEIPHPPLVGGVLFTFRNMAARFKLGPGYTSEIGEALGIDGSPYDPPSPDSVTPTINVTAAHSGAMFACVVSNRAESTAWRVEILRAGSSVWESVGVFTGKTAEVHVMLTNADKPEQIQVRVQLLRHNISYGNVSQAAAITVNP